MIKKTTVKETKKEPIASKRVIKKTLKSVKKPTPKTVAKQSVDKKPISVLRWKKITNGTHNHNGKTIKKGEILECSPNELSDIVKRHFVCLDKIPEEKDDGVVLKVQSTDDGKFNVINPKTNKPINEKTLTKTEAEKVIGKDIKE